LGLGGAKQHAIVAMLLDWLYNIVTLVIIHSPSLANGLESMNAKRLGLEPLGLREIEVRIGVLKWNMGTPSIIFWHLFKTFLENMSIYNLQMFQHFIALNCCLV
jgi:hypothetical protein